MPEADAPTPNEPPEGPPQPTLPTQPALVATAYRGKSLLMIGLEVVLISAGVFLGLMGEQWRERAEQRELAREALRRFRTEIRTNRDAVGANVDYHADLVKQIEAFLDPDKRRRVQLTNGLGPVFFEQAAWDLALATQALAYIDANLAFAISRAYTIQQNYAGLQGAVVQSVVYGRTPQQDPDGFWQSLLWYFNDAVYFDAVILKVYDEVLPQINRALGETPAAP